MGTINYPKVYLVSKPSVNFDQIAAFLEDDGLPGLPDSIRAGGDGANAIIETSARLCYMSFGRGRKDIADFITNLLTFKDGSVFEHVNYGFVITGISRSLTHELVRHRAGFAYSQRSQRYVDESAGNFVIPPVLQQLDGVEPREQLLDAFQRAEDAYARLVEELEVALPKEGFDRLTERRKAIRQAARAVLPNATETKIFVTANVRAWRHFIETRATPFADVEIRRLAVIILRMLQKEAPLMFGDFAISRLGDDTEIATPEHSKV